MDKLCKDIMKFMQKNGNNTAFSCSIENGWNQYADACFQELIDSVKDDPSNVYSAISALVNDGWLEYKDLYGKDGNIHIGVYMTHKGLHQKEYTWLAIKDFILKSVLVPVLVSVLTSAIVAWVGYLWTMSGVNGISTAQQSQTPSSEPTSQETVQTKNS